MADHPLLVVVGPSGVGKSTLAEGLVEGLRFLHFDLDRRNGFGVYGLRDAWHQFSVRLDAKPLASQLLARVAAANAAGAVLSLPSTRVLSWEQTEALRGAGVMTVVLWGSEEQCLNARLERENGRLDAGRYDRSNKNAFRTYGNAAFDDLRLDVFGPDGSRRSRDSIVALVRERQKAQSDARPTVSASTPTTEAVPRTRRGSRQPRA